MATDPDCIFFQHRSDEGWIYSHNASRPRPARDGDASLQPAGAREGSGQTAGPSRGRQVRFGPTTVVPLSPLSQSGRGRGRGRTERDGGAMEL